MVKHGSVQPYGRPTYKGTWCDLMMHVSPLLMHMLLMRHVKECVTSDEGTSVPHSCMSRQMTRSGNNVLTVYDGIADN